jgi:endonuclease/exonuclease/phosphatase family metal-dependent hydrolase
MGYISDRLEFGLEWASSALIEIYQPLTPGQFGRSPNRFYEIASRFFCAALAVPVGLAGLLHRLITPVPKEDFKHLRGCAPIPFPKEGPLSHLHINACCLEGGLPKLFGGMPPWWENDRIGALADLIIKHDPPSFDLSEMHSPLAARSLYEKLKDKYAHFYLDIGPHKNRYFNSGLFVATKYAASQESFKSFEMGQRQINKGAFSFEVEGRCQIIATHLEPGRGEKKAGIRAQELKIVEGLIDRALPATLISGDFNIETTDAEEFVFPPSFGQIAYPDVITSTDYFQALRCGQEPLEKESGHTVDYGFLRGGQLTCQVVETFAWNLKDGPPKSDHRGILLTAQFASQQGE